LSRLDKTRRLLTLLLAPALGFFLTQNAAAQDRDKEEAPAEIKSERLALLDRVVGDAVRAGQIPGAVVLIGHATPPR